MYPTYRAVLRGDQLEWEAGRPTEEPVRVHVTVIESLAHSLDSGTAMAKALADLTNLGGPSGFADLPDWREQSRLDRPLPGRSE